MGTPASALSVKMRPRSQDFTRRPSTSIIPMTVIPKCFCGSILRCGGARNPQPARRGRANVDELENSQLIERALALIRSDVHQILGAHGMFSGPEQHSVLLAKGPVLLLDYFSLLL